MTMPAMAPALSAALLWLMKLQAGMEALER
jgi:hypothetical protein